MFSIFFIALLFLTFNVSDCQGNSLTATDENKIAGERFVCVKSPAEWFLVTGEPAASEAMEASRSLPADYADKHKKIIWNSEKLFDFAEAAEVECKFRRPAFLLTSFYSDEDGFILVSAGADYFFEFFCNGVDAGGTLKHGNGGTPVSCSDHILKIPVKKGANTLVFYVQSGSRGWKGAMKFLEPDRKNLRRISTEALKINALPLTNELRYGPWVTHLQQDTATIHFTTQGQTAVAVDFRASGEPVWQRRFSVLNRYLRRDRDRHSITLNDLHAGTQYEFRIVIFPKDETKNGGLPPVPETEVLLPDSYSFRTLADECGKIRFSIMADTHLPNKSRLDMLKKYNDRYHFSDGDFFVHLGDIASSIDNFDDEILGGFTEFFDQNGKITPLCVVHGNHEYSGKEAYLWNPSFASPDGRSFYAFTAGPAFVLVLDYWGAMQPAPGAQASNWNDFEREQDEWITRVISSDACRNAKFRIVLNHCPPFSTKKDESGEPEVVCYLPDLMRRLKPLKWHLFVSGHKHIYQKNILNETVFLTLAGGESPERLNLTEVEIDAERLKVRSGSSDGEFFDEFTITAI